MCGCLWIEALWAGAVAKKKKRKIEGGKLNISNVLIVVLPFCLTLSDLYYIRHSLLTNQVSTNKLYIYLFLKREGLVSRNTIDAKTKSQGNIFISIFHLNPIPS